MKFAIVTDIHANWQAWSAVLKDIEKVGVDSVLCLGDVIGYGPSPAQVMESAYTKCDHFVLGNHDAVVGDRLDSELFNDNAKYIIDWTRNQLSSEVAQFFSDMPLRMEGPGFVCAHGELAVPGRFGYIYNADDSIESFKTTEAPLMFVGHTHQPAVFACNQSAGTVQQVESHDFVVQTDLRYLVNAGSVGDPRDGTTKATYVIYDAETKQVSFRHVPFDVAEYRRDLETAMLPTKNYFLSVDAGTYVETDTLKDMRLAEGDMTLETRRKTMKVSGKHLTRQSIKFGKGGLATQRLRASTRRVNREELGDLSSGSTTKHDMAQKSKSKLPMILGVVIFGIVAIVGAILALSGDEKAPIKQVAQEQTTVQDDMIVIVDEPEIKERTVVEVTQEGGALLINHAEIYKDGSWYPVPGTYLEVNHKTILKWRVKFAEMGSYAFSKTSFGDISKTTFHLSSDLKFLGTELSIDYGQNKKSSSFQVTKPGNETDFIITFPEASQLNLRALTIHYIDDGSEFRRKIAEKKAQAMEQLAEEKREAEELAKQKLAEEKAAKEKALEEQRLAEEKTAKEAEEKALAEKKLAEEKALAEKKASEKEAEVKPLTPVIEGLTVLEDFESRPLKGWTLSSSFYFNPHFFVDEVNNAYSKYLQPMGQGFINTRNLTYKEQPGGQVRLISPAYTIDKPYLHYLTGGMPGSSQNFYLRVEGTTKLIPLPLSKTNVEKAISLKTYQGKEVRFILQDAGPGRTASFIWIDQLCLSDSIKPIFKLSPFAGQYTKRQALVDNFLLKKAVDNKIYSGDPLIEDKQAFEAECKNFGELYDTVYDFFKRPPKKYEMKLAGFKTDAEFTLEKAKPGSLIELSAKNVSVQVNPFEIHPQSLIKIYKEMKKENFAYESRMSRRNSMYEMFMGSTKVQFSKIFKAYNIGIEAKDLRFSSSSADYPVPFSAQCYVNSISDKSDNKFYAKPQGKQGDGQSRNLLLPYLAPVKRFVFEMPESQPKDAATFKILLVDAGGKSMWTTGDFSSLSSRQQEFEIFPTMQNDASQLPQE